MFWYFILKEVDSITYFAEIDLERRWKYNICGGKFQVHSNKIETKQKEKPVDLILDAVTFLSIKHFSYLICGIPVTWIQRKM
jgi:CRISPR/Cas system CMR-associated protein Cmr3 (group 5 of RAMP superfamily)